MSIMDLRAYERAYRAVQQAENSANSVDALAALPDSVRAMVREVEFDIVREMRGDA